MASNAQTTVNDSEQAPRTTIEEHQATYDGFIFFSKVGIIAVVVLLIAMLIFLV